MAKVLWLPILLLGCSGDEPAAPPDLPSGPTVTDPGTERDRDEDGAPASEDCDDRDPARFPGNDERCDGIDNDCDEEVDEDPVDPVDLYTDGDGDGVGVGDPVAQACAAGTGLAITTGDCDDTNAEVAPGFDEQCDGLDNDCDQQVDLNVVPRDYPDIPTAVNAVGSGEVCVMAGTWAAALGAIDDVVTVVAASGPEATFLELTDGQVPWATVGAGGVLTLEGFGVRGLDARSADTTLIRGALVVAESGAALTLTNVVFDELTASVSNTTTGVLIDATSATVHLEDVELRGMALELTGNASVSGVLLGQVAGELTVDGLLVSGVVVTSGSGAAGCELYGLVSDTSGTEVDLLGLDIQGLDVTLTCTEQVVAEGALVRHDQGDFLGLDWALEDISLALAAPEATLDGLVWIDEGTGGALDGVEMHRNSVSVQGSTSAFARGLVYLEGVLSPPLRHLTATGNAITVDATDGDGEALGGVVHSAVTFAVLQWADFRGNTLSADDQVEGGAVYSLSQYLTIENAIFAGNVIEATQPSSIGSTIGTGGGLSALFASDAEIELWNVDFVGNRVESVDWASGGALGLDFTSWGSGAIPPTITLSRVNFVDNATVGPTGDGWALTTDEHIELTYSNARGNTGGPGAEFDGILDPIGVDGNVSVEPAFMDVSAADPAAWDLTLAAGSPLIDAGDPAVLDPDGTVCDIGAYGGPLSGLW